MITIKIAGLNVGIDNKHRYIERLAQDYLTEAKADFVVSASEEEINAERGQTEVGFSDGYLESIVAYRKIAEMLPSYDAFVFHGAVLSLDGKAYAFTAKSGVGKTTHTRLWLKTFGERVHYLNGDKPIIRFIDGIPYACGTPWQGKENYGVNEMAPLVGIAFLRRGEKNRARLVPSGEIITDFVTQMYMPRNTAGAMLSTMRMADRVIGAVRLVELYCNMEDSAAEISHAVLSGSCDEAGE
ncbi:MAG: hypothetical protein IJY24_02520 [Clostridia bacterium]|nr:hypothetical protein [Clostridia bacterium]